MKRKQPLPIIDSMIFLILIPCVLTLVVNKNTVLTDKVSMEILNLKVVNLDR